MREADPEFFNRLVNQQRPEYLWIGCSDSRVPANQILGMAPGEIFVQRNVGNQAMHTDLNLMACLEYAVKSLKVKTIILCGHYNCGAVKAALQLPHTTPGLVNCWISDIRECRNQAEAELRGLQPEQQLARLCELNVLRQVFHVATSPVVAGAWAEGQEVHVYGAIYDLADGHLRKLAGPINGDDKYNRSLEGFVMDGLRVTQCPGTQLMRVSSAHDTSSHAVLAAASARSAGTMRGVGGTVGAMAVECGTTIPASPCALRKTGSSSSREEAGSAASDECPLGIASSPSELATSINNINLAESIAKHKQWTQAGDTNGSGNVDSGSTLLMSQGEPVLQVAAVRAAAARC
ncbi:carbonic anhydrase [Scenedesmus sp. NREL 46B-D3]|nr:carbonic anhydrase [Scenedesmus sp. NREL 46B-D3]